MSTISHTTDQATEHVKEAASHARATLLDLSAQMMKLLHGAREAEGRGVEALLERMGLQRRRSAAGPVIWFAVGAAVAGTAVALLAPTSGKKLRQRIATFFGAKAATLATETTVAEEGAGRMPNGVKHEAV